MIERLQEDTRSLREENQRLRDDVVLARVEGRNQQQFNLQLKEEIENGSQNTVHLEGNKEDISSPRRRPMPVSSISSKRRDFRICWC
ncbi:hypothetical protein FRX31_033278 [Thalictrum thalictroides]|uniref:Uncharacterized protein n=1 Tax=Thalictrum thalictroides TaxID=46969 RepID=A0A7J6UWZ1_THATH|nr:hypothetical protein FRX31_033278 [Thalictrum thalictroides]